MRPQLQRSLLQVQAGSVVPVVSAAAGYLIQRMAVDTGSVTGALFSSFRKPLLSPLPGVTRYSQRCSLISPVFYQCLDQRGDHDPRLHLRTMSVSTKPQTATQTDTKITIAKMETWPILELEWVLCSWEHWPVKSSYGGHRFDSQHTHVTAVYNQSPEIQCLLFWPL